MTNRLPAFLDRHKICIICEGDEEYDYLERLKSLQVWDEQYDIFLDNADGNGNIPARYQDRFQNGSYEVVLVFCDTDKKPFEHYKERLRVTSSQKCVYRTGISLELWNTCLFFCHCNSMAVFRKLN